MSESELKSDPPHESFASTPVFELKGLTFRYPGQHLPALNQISLKLWKGQTVAVCGPNGSGKSTLVAVLMGFELAPTATFFIDGDVPESGICNGR